jgi:hypothetical protein
VRRMAAGRGRTRANETRTETGPGAVAPEPSRCRIADSRRTRKSLKEVREAVSDRVRAVRSRGERPPARGAPKHRR